ncbi:MAG: hypothetical protein INR73_07040 [Williamsia sp.]|nr:hypothetical protein [Williamsia sp.]
MDNEVYFSERQKFKQWWLWVILLGINGLLLFGVFKQLIAGQQFGDKPMSNMGLLLIAGLSLLLTALFYNFRLETQVKKDGIYVRFFPFHLSYHRYTWEKVSRSFIRQYNPIGEYGGWGLRLGPSDTGKALNVSGNQGLQLEFTNKKKLLIGTNKPAELAETLNKIGQLKP